MKYIKQLIIIILFSLLGKIFNKLLPFSIPASIYGMILLFMALITKIVKLDQIEETAEFLLSIMLIFFIPTSVSIMNTFFKYKESMISLILIIFISTIIVLIVTSLSTDFAIKITRKDKK